MMFTLSETQDYISHDLQKNGGMLGGGQTGR